MSIPLPTLGLLVKLGSIAVHAEELISPKGHPFDKVALETLINDPEIRDWLAMMNHYGMLPVKR